MVNDDKLVRFLKEVTYTDVHIYNNDEVVDEWLELSFECDDLFETFKTIAKDLRYRKEYIESEATELLKDYLKEVDGLTDEEVEQTYKEYI